MESPTLFKRITIIGMGLIGSSIARAATEHRIAEIIVGCDENEISLAYAHKHGFITHHETDAADAVDDADLIILSTPPATLGAIAETIVPHLRKGALIMDVCSVKAAAIADIAPHIPDGVHFIPAHPIAGSEHTGVAAGRADLFQKKRVILTPVDLRHDFMYQQATAFWQALGARCEAMPAATHDLIYAYVSHLPQLLAFAAAEPLAEYEALEQSDPLLQKFMRLTHSDPDLWIQIFILNRDNVIAALDRYLDVIAHVVSEFAQGPDTTNASAEDERLARTALFPRIAASCLITTVMDAEKKAGFSFARYAGTGFADFTYPASQPPEGDMESISDQYRAVALVLSEFTQRLKEFHQAIASGEEELLPVG